MINTFDFEECNISDPTETPGLLRAITHVVRVAGQFNQGKGPKIDTDRIFDYLTKHISDIEHRVTTDWEERQQQKWRPGYFKYLDHERGRKFEPFHDLLAAEATPGEIRGKIIALLEREFERFDRPLGNRDSAIVDRTLDDRTELYGLTLEYCSGKQRAVVQEKIETHLADPKQRSNMVRSLITYTLGEYPTAEKIVRPHLNQWLEETGLPADRALEIWKNSCGLDKDGRYGAPSIIAKNTMERFAATVADLEDEQPGLVGQLFRDYGIVDFARHPKELLQEQVQAAEDTERPYGLVLMPYDDWNGAISDQSRILSTIREQLGGQYLLRVMEAGSKREIAERLITLDCKYGSKQKIRFLIVKTHGNQEAMLKQDRAFVKHQDFAGPGVARAKEFFDQEAQVVLLSCSTGQEKGIGQKISETWGNPVIAPDNISGTKSVTVTLGERVPRFEVQYGRDGLPVLSKNYIGGQEISS